MCVFPSFFDVETTELASKTKPSSQLPLAIAGVRSENKNTLFSPKKLDPALRVGTLEALFHHLRRAPMLVGHNVIDFDYQVVQKYGDPSDVKAWQAKTVDMFAILRRQTGEWFRLEDLAEANLGMSKKEDSREVPALWTAGQHQRVIEYLNQDLEMTQRLYESGKTNGFLLITKERDPDTWEWIPCPPRKIKISW